jgi:cobalt-zinc-cadmium efflux system membrane fusion protein
MNRPLLTLALLALACNRDAPIEAVAEHADEHEHGDEHGDGHGHDELPTRVELSDRVIAEAGIVTEPARRQIVAPVLLATGHVEADPGRSAQVPAKVAGVVESVLFREGDVVKEGAVLATVRAPGLGGLRADLASVQARTVSAKSNLTRLEMLAQRNMASQQELAAARAEATALDAEGRAARQRLQALGLAATGNASIFSLRAPISGSITVRAVLPGQAVTAESSVATIVSIDRAWFVARIFEHMLARVRVGASAEVELNAYGHERFTGRIELIGRQIDPVARTVVARIRLSNRQELLRLGLFGTARIARGDAQKGPRSLVVPRSAITEIDGKSVVFVRHPDDDFELHEVVLGRAALDKVEVLSGLREKEDVVVEGVFTLKSLVLKSTLAEDE